MRQPLITAREALRQRMVRPDQVPPTAPEATLPPYMETFLAHVRLLVGVPFENLIPDPRLLPTESIRFFYLDRSWSDRLVDGATAVGQIGSREQAHDHGAGDAMSRQLDQSERLVRLLQRGEDLETARADPFAQHAPAEVITGLVVRSSAVAGWPHMDVRAYDTRIPEPFDTSAQSSLDHQLDPLRIERLAPSVIIALFQGVPELVILEEPHHGVQFGIQREGPRVLLPMRDAGGQLLQIAQRAIRIDVPMRASNSSVIRVRALRDALVQKRQALINDHVTPPAVEQTGSASFAVAVLDPPWRQRFEGTEDKAGDAPAPPGGGFVIDVSQVVTQASLRTSVQRVLGGG